MIKNNVTPMMKQYLEIKEQHADCLLFFRLGDFYELFFEDAQTASKELEITLTGRDCGLEERAPMCGVPYHAATNYIAKLIEKGYKVAVCEQVEDPATAKGIVKREVIRIVTPGTILEGHTLSERNNNYIASVVYQNGVYGISLCDVTTGEWRTTTISGEDSTQKMLDELARWTPVECLLDSATFTCEKVSDFIATRFTCLKQEIPSYCLDNAIAEEVLLTHFQLSSLEGIGLKNNTPNMLATASLLSYLQETQKTDLTHMHTLTNYALEDYMVLDIATRRNLELTETMREKKRKGSLLWVLDHTKTAMGARYLTQCIKQPLIDAVSINQRLDAVEELKDNVAIRLDIVESLEKIYDIERLMSKVSYGTVNPKDLLALKQSLQMLPLLQKQLTLADSALLKEITNNWDNLTDMYTLIDRAILEDAPLSLREANIIKEGYDETVDHLRKAKREGTTWLAQIEQKEREKTGIKNLKIKYNKVFGYFLEVTHSYLPLVPDYFIRKQTLSGCERYITEELKKIEEEILGAQEKLCTLEYQLFLTVRETVLENIQRLLNVSHQIAKIDMICALAQVAEKNHYVKPIVDSADTIHITGGRHPVVEKIIGEHRFIANEVYLNEKEQQIVLLTGPNMAGKSTYMRQVALIVLMAQIGSFVPAESAQIGIVDRIFTRVGASDDLASGQSTFMIEMMEVSNILHHATSKSLLILDEIGRGTSTMDGLSIAWSILEYLSDKEGIGAKTLFATHYHELTKLEEKLPNLKNYCVAVQEKGENIVFLHTIVPGSVDRSYGIEVAKLAGVPKQVLNRAKVLLDQLEAPKAIDVIDTIADTKSEVKQTKETMQLSLFTTPEEEMLLEFKKLDVLHLNPIQALEILYQMQKKIME